MRLPACLLALCAVSLAACAKRAQPEPVAGVFAVQGPGTVRRGEQWQRSPQAGMTLASDMTLELPKGSRAVLEGFNGLLVPLGAGTHALKSVRGLSLPPTPKRRVYWVTDTAEEREVAGLISQARYEPMQSGRKLPDPDDDAHAENMAFFFSPAGAPDDPAAGAPQPPPWIANRDFIRPLRRPLVPGDGSRRLVEAEGFVVVEFGDHATAFAQELKLPLDLADVARVVVVEGEAKLSLPDGETLELGDGEEAELH